MSIEDKLGILEQTARYSRTWDAKDAAGWASLFTEGSIVVNPQRGTTSAPRSFEKARDGAQADFDGRLARVQTRHHQTNTIFVELTADYAKTETMLLLTRQTADDAAPRVVMTGVYEREWRKTADGWKIYSQGLRSDNPPPPRE